MTSPAGKDADRALLLDRLRTFVAGPPPSDERVALAAVPPEVRQLDRILFGGEGLVPIDPSAIDLPSRLGPDLDLARAELAGRTEAERLAVLGALAASEEARRAGRLLDAVDACLAALPAAPDCLALQLRLADLEHQLGLDGVVAEKLGLLAQSYQLRGDATGVARVYQRLLAVAPGQTDQMAQYARVLEERGFPAEAAAWWLALSRRLRQEGRPSEARPAAERACALLPESAEAQLELGLALLDLGRPAQAGVAFGRALVFDPAAPAPAAYLLLVSALYEEPLEPMLGKLLAQLAARRSDSAASASPDPGFVDRLLASGERALAAGQGGPGLRHLLGSLAAVAGQVERARQHLLAAAEARAARGDAAGQVAELEAAGWLLPDDPTVRRALGEALLRSGQVGRALKELRAAAQLEVPPPSSG